MNKQWWQSKGVWIGILAALVGSLEVIKEAVVSGDFSSFGIITVTLGVLKVWERVARSS